MLAPAAFRAGSPSRVTGEEVNQNHRNVSQDCGDYGPPNRSARDSKDSRPILAVRLRKSLMNPGTVRRGSGDDKASYYRPA